MIDLHAHILPGVDDGPPTLADSLALARAAVVAGTRVMAATSHVDYEMSVEPSEVTSRVEQVNAALQANGIELEVVTGGEIAISKVIDLSEEELLALRLGGGAFLLVEAPFSPVVGDFDPVLLDLQVRGHRVLLGHPERCPSFQRRPERLDGLVEAGVLLQVTANSFLGDFGNDVRKFAIDLVKRDLVHVLASDTHDTKRRPPGLDAGLRAARRWVPELSNEHRDYLCNDVAAAILGRAPMPERPPLRQRAGLLRRLKRA